MQQTIIFGDNAFSELEQILKSRSKLMLVCDSAFNKMSIADDFESLSIPQVKFTGFTPNPDYYDIINCAKQMLLETCDTIISIGGGSAIDVAKCAKLFSSFDLEEDCLGRQYVENDIMLIAIPTTAGSGSESTANAVIYRKHIKQSVGSPFMLPEYAVLIPKLLETLPIYQKKCTSLDAYCQAVEAWWSMSSTEQSREVSRRAVELIASNLTEFVAGGKNSDMMKGANLGGEAIKLAQTTAPHAMAYKITTKYNLPHGHAVALCFLATMRRIFENVENTTDPRGAEYLKSILAEISVATGTDDLIGWFEAKLKEFELTAPDFAADDAVSELVNAVDTAKLKTTPVKIDKEALLDMFKSMNCVK